MTHCPRNGASTIFLGGCRLHGGDRAWNAGGGGSLVAQSGPTLCGLPGDASPGDLGATHSCCWIWVPPTVAAGWYAPTPSTHHTASILFCISSSVQSALREGTLSRRSVQCVTGRLTPQGNLGKFHLK